MKNAPGSPAAAPNRATEAATAPASLASDQRKLELTRAGEDYKEVRKAVDDAGAFVRGLWITFVSLGTYLVVVVWSITHRQLFLEDPIKLPLVDVALPLYGFFLVAPLFFLVLHFYLLLQIRLLARKVSDLNSLIRTALPSDDDAGLRGKLRQQLPNDILVQFLAGPRDERDGTLGFLFRGIAWATMAVGPVFLLLLVQWRFLPYQSETATWLHRLAVILDLLLLWSLWWVVVSDQAVHAVWRIAKAGAGLAAAACVAAVSFIALTFPGESADGWLLAEQLHAAFLEPGPDRNREPNTHDREWLERTPQARRWITGTLKLPLLDIIDDEKLARIVQRGIEAKLPPWQRERTFRLSGTRIFRFAAFSDADLRYTDLRGAVLDGANLHRANLDGVLMDRAELFRAELQGARLNGASLVEAALTEAKLDAAQLQGALLDRVRMPSASLPQVKLEGASLRGANLRGSRLSGAEMPNAVLDEAQLDEATLHDAKMQGASLKHADMRRARLNRAEMQKARLDSAILTDAHLDEAKFEGAVLDGASLQYASLREAEMQGASFRAAKMQSAFLNGARMSNAKLDKALLDEADLSAADLQEASLTEASLQGAVLQDARLRGAVLDKAQLQGAVLDRAVLAGASLEGTQLQGASLQHAQLQGAWLRSTQMQGALLDGAQLQAAMLLETQLQGTSLSHASMDGALLQGSDGAWLLWVENSGTVGNADRPFVSMVWRSHGAPPTTRSASINAMSRSAGASRSAKNFDQLPEETASETKFSNAVVLYKKSITEWRDKVLAAVESETARLTVAKRLEVLTASNNPPDALERFWREKHEERIESLISWETSLQELLEALVCRPSLGGTDSWLSRAVERTHAPFLARGLMRDTLGGFLENPRISSTGARLHCLARRMKEGQTNSETCPGVHSFTPADWARLDVLVARKHGMEAPCTWQEEEAQKQPTAAPLKPTKRRR